MPETTDHAHEDGNERMKLGCVIHDPNGHWKDDEAYVDTERLPVPEFAPHWDDMVEKIKASKPDEDPSIYKFVLVFVEGDTGNIDAMAAPGMESMVTINLLTRAASLMAFQQSEKERHLRKMIMDRMMGGNLTEAMFMPIAPQKKEEDPPPNTGQYL